MSRRISAGCWMVVGRDGLPVEGVFAGLVERAREQAELRLGQPWPILQGLGYHTVMTDVWSMKPPQGVM